MGGSASDLRLIAGTTFAFAATWQSQDGGQLVPVDITGCTARLQMRHATRGELLVEASTESGTITIATGTDGQVAVSLPPSATKALKASKIGEVVYELRVYFPSGDVYSLMSGFVAVVEGVIRD